MWRIWSSTGFRQLRSSERNILNDMEKGFSTDAGLLSSMKHPIKSEKKKPVKIGNRCYIGEHAIPKAKWLENAECPNCGSMDLMDARGMGLCVACNKFVKPKKSKR